MPYNQVMFLPVLMLSTKIFIYLQTQKNNWFYKEFKSK